MFACIYIPDFSVEALVRAEPLLRERAVAVLEGKPPQVRVVALNENARLSGMEVGMTKLQAAVFAEPETVTSFTETTVRKEGSKQKATRIELSSRRTAHKRKSSFAILRQRSPEQESSAHAALLDVAHSFTPRVEDTAFDMLLLDLAGLQRLYGPPVKMGHDLAARVSAIGLESNVVVAANPDSAMHAAMGFAGTAVIPAGEEASRLGVLPLALLLNTFELSLEKRSVNDRERAKRREQMLDILERWGVRDFRTLALLPEHALASRLGEAGTQLQQLARGAGVRPLALCEPQSHFEEAMELETAVETIESLSFLLNRLLEQLCARLEARALSVQELRLRLQLDRRVADEETTTAAELSNFAAGSHIVEEQRLIFQRVLRLPVAMRDVKIFLKLLQLELSAHPPGGPVTKLWIRAEPAPPRTAQRGLFLPVTPEAEKLEITLARINNIVGERKAGIARLLNTHRNRFRLEQFSTPEESTAKPSLTMSDAQESPFLALRIFRPAVRLQVQLAKGRPIMLSALTNQTRWEELQGKVLWSAGPWRSSGDWWTENAKDDTSQHEIGAWDREEWDVAVSSTGEGKALYRIYRDLACGDWFADASYD